MAEAEISLEKAAKVFTQIALDKMSSGNPGSPFCDTHVDESGILYTTFVKGEPVVIFQGQGNKKELFKLFCLDGFKKTLEEAGIVDFSESTPKK